MAVGYITQAFCPHKLSQLPPFSHTPHHFPTVFFIQLKSLLGFFIRLTLTVEQFVHDCMQLKSSAHEQHFVHKMVYMYSEVLSLHITKLTEAYTYPSMYIPLHSNCTDPLHVPQSHTLLCTLHTNHPCAPFHPPRSPPHLPSCWTFPQCFLSAPCPSV